MDYFQTEEWLREKFGDTPITNYSGGADGADITFELEGEKYGVKTEAYSFYGHKTNSKNRKILTDDELDEGVEHVKIANKTLKRHIGNLSPYVKKLLARDWFQVKNSDTIFAVSTLLDESKVDGGTGWAVQMGIDNNKIVYVFDQNKNKWFRFSYIIHKFIEMDSDPILTDNFAGIGSRDLNENGTNAILRLYKNKFNIL
jgi:hypothetical protein